MHIGIIGGGIGGLALAAGLRRRGYRVDVFERDNGLDATGGYHITLDGRAQVALEPLIGPALYERLLASASAVRLRPNDVFWDRRGRMLGRGPSLAGDPSVDVDRITLRRILAEAFGDDLHWGTRVSRIDRDPAERPVVTFADDTAVTVDLLVGADGTHSLVSRHLAGRPVNESVGITGVSGRTPAALLTEGERRRLGPRSSLAVGPTGTALYVGYLDPAGNAVLDAAHLRESTTTTATYIWGAMFADPGDVGTLRTLICADLSGAVVTTLERRGWDRLEVVSRTDPATVASFEFRTAPAEAEKLAPWPAGTITALGDAVHSTPPTAGMGAGAAIRDAASLVHHLDRVRNGETTVTVAVSGFEAEMRWRGGESIAAAMRAIGWIHATRSPWGAVAATHLTPVLALAQGLRRRAGRGGPQPVARGCACETALPGRGTIIGTVSR